MSGTDEEFLVVLKQIADDIASTPTTNEVSLDNKLVLSICIRILAEEFLQKVINQNTGSCVDSSSNQTKRMA